MPTFAYTAKDKMGQEVQKTQDASSKEALIKSLRDQGLFPTSVEEQKTSALAKKAAGKSFSFGFGKRVGIARSLSSWWKLMRHKELPK